MRLQEGVQRGLELPEQRREKRKPKPPVLSCRDGHPAPKQLSSPAVMRPCARAASPGKVARTGLQALENRKIARKKILLACPNLWAIYTLFCSCLF